MLFLAAVFTVCPLVSVLAFVAPKATPAADAIELRRGWAPLPTEPPRVEELLKRQSSESLTLIEGPDTICGYQFGSSSGALALCGTLTCGFATALDQSGDIFCYGHTTSEARPPWTSCIGGTGVASCLADSACSNNPGIIVCTLSTEAYCNVGTFVGLGLEAVWCDSTSYRGSTIPIYTTYSGQLGRTFTNPAGAAQTSPTIPTPTPTPTSSTLTSSPLPKTITPTTLTITPTPSPTPKPKKSSTPIGAIVGGVIGGLAFIAAIIAGVFLCRRQQHTNKQTDPLPVQTYHQNNPSEKYPATSEAVFVPSGSPPTLAKPEQQVHFQPPHQPQYQQPQNVYQPPQQQSPQPTGNYMEQQQSVQQPVQQPIQTQQHYQAPLVQSQPPSAELPNPHGGPVVSAVSTPGSPPAPPYSNIPTVSEMTGESNHQVHSTENRYEM